MSKGFLVTTFVVLCTLITPIFAASANQSTNKEFVLGVVSSKPKTKIKQGTPFANYLASHLKSYGYTQGRVQVFSNYKQLGNALKSGRVHLANATPFNAVNLEQNYDAELIANRWKRNQEKYHSVFFTHRDSSVQTLNDLKGKTVVFEKKDSTSSYFLPMLALFENNIEVQYLEDINRKPDSDKVGYLLLEEHLEASNEINLSLWVFKNRVDAGAFSNYNWDNPKDLPEGIKKNLKIVGTTIEIPRDILLASPTLTSEEQQEILSIVTSISEEDAKTVLKPFQKTSKFSRIEGELETSLDMIRHVASSIR